MSTDQLLFHFIVPSPDWLFESGGFVFFCSEKPNAESLEAFVLFEMADLGAGAALRPFARGFSSLAAATYLWCTNESPRDNVQDYFFAAGSHL